MRHNLRDSRGRFRCAPPRRWIRFWLVEDMPSPETFRLARQMLAAAPVPEKNLVRLGPNLWCYDID